MEKALVDNLIDGRNILAYCNAKSLPNGELGLCLLCLSGNKLSVFDTDFSQEIGRKLYEVALSHARNVQSSSFVLRRFLKFEADGNKYHFADFGDAKRILKAILEETAQN